MAIENANNVHSSERSQVKDRTKPAHEQYAEFAQLNDSRYVASSTVEEINNYNVKVLEE